MNWRGEREFVLNTAAWNDSGWLISVISFGIVFQMRMARGSKDYASTTVFKRDRGTM